MEEYRKYTTAIFLYKSLSDDSLHINFAKWDTLYQYCEQDFTEYRELRLLNQLSSWAASTLQYLLL